MPYTLPDEELQRLLREDAPWGDLTTATLGLSERLGRLRFVARRPMTVCGSEEALRLFELCGATAQLQVASGQHVQSDTELLYAQGSAPSLLLAWGVAHTLLEYASGIASEVARIVTSLRAAGYNQPLACTRQCMPGARLIAAKAVQAGGGVMHRLGLSDSLLMVREHRLFIDGSLADALQRVRCAQPELRLVVEADDLGTAMALAQAGAEVLQLERFTPEAVRNCRMTLRAAGLDPVLAVAGGVSEANALAYAEAGADVLVSSAPYQAAPAAVATSFSRV